MSYRDATDYTEGSDSNISASLPTSPSQCDVAVLSNGNIVTTWKSNGNRGYFHIHQPDGTVVKTATICDGDVGINAENIPQVAALSNSTDKFVVSWANGSASYFAIYDNDGTESVAATAWNNAAYDQFASVAAWPESATTNKGNFLVVTLENHKNLVARKYNSSGTALTLDGSTDAMRVNPASDTGNDYSTNSSSYKKNPVPLCLENDQFVIVYNRHTGTQGVQGYEIYATVWEGDASDSPKPTPIEVDTDAEAHISPYDCHAIDLPAGFLVSWKASVTDKIYARSFSMSAATSDTTEVVDHGATVYMPRVALLSDDATAVLAWRDSNSDGWLVYLQAAGSGSGSLSIVDGPDQILTGSAIVPLSPTPVSLHHPHNDSTGDFVVVAVQNDYIRQAVYTYDSGGGGGGDPYVTPLAQPGRLIKIATKPGSAYLLYTRGNHAITGVTWRPNFRITPGSSPSPEELKLVYSRPDFFRYIAFAKYGAGIELEEFLVIDLERMKSLQAAEINRIRARGGPSAAHDAIINNRVPFGPGTGDHFKVTRMLFMEPGFKPFGFGNIISSSRRGFESINVSFPGDAEGEEVTMTLGRDRGSPLFRTFFKLLPAQRMNARRNATGLLVDVNAAFNPRRPTILE